MSQEVIHTGYGFQRTVALSFDAAVERIRQTLKAEGFGVLTEIDMQDALKKKLGVDFRRYLILGACNPPLAFQAVSSELEIGLLLPCNVIVYEADDSAQTVVSAVNAGAMLSVVGPKPELAPIADQVNAKLARAVANV